MYCSKGCQNAHLGYHAVFCSAIVDLKNMERNKLYGNYTVSQNASNYKTKMKLMKLVGEKPILNCYLGGKRFEMLWDIGSMISMVSRSWVNKNFPDLKIHSVSDFLGDELHVRAANSTKISFDRVCVLEFYLDGADKGFEVPLLVASQDEIEPILGYNVIEHLILNGSAWL